jgi:hypothetical protein
MIHDRSHRALTALAAGLAACHHPGSTAMPALVASPVTADVEPVPTGVAAPGGDELYLQVAGGIDAVDPDTGETRWSTRAGAVPVLALADALLALDTAATGELTWTGTARLIAIDRAPPHAVRRGPVFILPDERARFLDVRAIDGALEAWWSARATGGGRLDPAAPPVDGALRVDLTDNAARVSPNDAWPPAPVRAALAKAAVWTPTGRGHAAWRAGDGWSAIAVDAGGVPSLLHWSGAAGPTTVALLDPRYRGFAAVEHVDHRRAYLRVCEPAQPASCQIRIHDAITGAPLGVVPAANAHGRLSPPFAVFGDDLLAVRLAPAPDRSRALVRIDATGAERWRRALPATPVPGFPQAPM